MNSLHKTCEYGRKAIIALIIVSSLALVAAAQKVEPMSQGKMYGDPGFRGEPINLNVVNADIRDILNYITEQYGINFVIDKSVKNVPVTVNVSQVPWNIALDSILRSQELGIQVNGTILRVADSKTLASEGEIIRSQRDTQLDASPLYTEFIRLNYARASGTSEPLGTTTASSGSSDLSSSSSGGGILPIIKRRLSRRGSIEIDSRSNTLIITDVRENIDAVRQLVALLDQPEPQVEIESRIVVATRAFSRDIGVQLSAFVVGPRGSGAGGGTLPVTTGLTRPPGFPTPSVNGALGITNAANTAIGLTTGIFGTAQISALITAGEQKNQLKVIASPRVTALNNRPAEIKSGLKIPITTAQGGGGLGNGAPLATTTYIDVPLRLAITPQITDVGTVVLNIVAENSTVSATDFTVAPAISTQSMTTQVTVPDGGTTVVGGVLFDDERELKARTPGLSRVPIFGELFKRKSVQRNTNEILFFITPRIARPDFPVTSGSSGVKTSATILQPVPLGNPASNSDQAQPTPSPTPVVPVLPVVKPDAIPNTPTKP